jgi:pimeloyl-ACP methyl ester carboxylesterase
MMIYAEEPALPQGPTFPGPDRSLPAALFRDPPPDMKPPAQTLPQAIPSQGVNLNAVLYMAGGPGPHPTILLLHGLPGNEQNIDLAQSMRRAGWNVLTVHYGGSWGGPGTFSFARCLEDATASIDWLRDPARDEKLRIDPRRIAVVGHSMGGFVAAHVAAQTPDIIGAALISGVDLGQAFGSADVEQAASVVDENVGISAGLHILAGTTPRLLAQEARANAQRWCLAGYAASLVGRPLLIVTSNDGFAPGSDALADAVRLIGGKTLERAHFSTDHSYSGCRIQLQATVLEWLARVASGSVPGRGGDGGRQPPSAR